MANSITIVLCLYDKMVMTVNDFTIKSVSPHTDTYIFILVHTVSSNRRADTCFKDFYIIL